MVQVMKCSLTGTEYRDILERLDLDRHDWAYILGVHHTVVGKRCTGAVGTPYVEAILLILLERYPDLIDEVLEIREYVMMYHKVCD